MKKIFLIIILLSLTAFGEKTRYLPQYQPETQVDDDVLAFLNQDSLRLENVKRFVRNKTTRDILGRLSRDTTIYVLREEIVEKRIPVGIVDLALRNKQDENSIEFYRNQNGDKFVRLNGNEISLDEFHKIDQMNAERKREMRRESFVRFENMTAQQIRELINDPKPVRIFLKKELSRKIDEGYVPYSYIFAYTGVNGMHTVGAKGNGVGLFFEEPDCPDNVAVLNVYKFNQFDSCITPGSHATKVAKLMQLTAPEAMVVSFVGFGSSSLSVVSAVDNYANHFSPKLQIGSYSWHYNASPCTGNAYCIVDQDLDQHVYEDRLIYFVAAGNMDDSSDVYVGSPGKALNAITVGAVNPHTGAYTSYSKWKNSEIGNQKPEIANYTNFYFDGTLGHMNGTSASTPYSAAIAANVLSVDSALKRHPEVIKSMFLVSATIPIVGGDTYDNDDWYSISSNLPHFDLNDMYRYRWWSGGNSSFFDNDEKIVFWETGVAAGKHCLAAISWLTSGSYAGFYKMLAQDIDLYVYQGSDNPIAVSSTAINPYEVVDFYTQSNANLKFEIRRFVNSQSDDVILGFAMRCDND